jgi:hypothetical protein
MKIETIVIDECMFFLPSDVSAKVARRNEPKRQSIKNENCGKPVRKLLAHSRFH